jgi:hypothetical protein
MMRSPIKTTACVTATAILASAFSSCTGITFQSGDALKSIYSVRVTDLKNKYATGNSFAQEIERAELDPSGRARNQLLNDFIFLIDNNYIFWEKHLYNKKAFADFGADVTATSLSTLSGIVSGGGVQGAKSILSFIAGGITSTRASFDSHILQSQNLLAIVAKMRAQRAEKLIPLQTGMYQNQSTAAAPLSAYSVNQGLIDLSAYYQAGTFVSALQDIIDKAGKDKSDSEQTVKELKGIN